MVAKHYHANHYLIPELCLMALNWIFIFFFLHEKLALKYHNAFALFPILLLLITTGVVGMNRNYLQIANQGYIRSNQDYDKMKKLLNTEYKDYICAYYYPTSINPYSALRWGNVYSLFNHTGALKTLYPDAFFFNIRTNSFSLWETPVVGSIMSKISGGKLLIVGGPFENDNLKHIQQSGLNLTKVYEGYTQVIYKVDFDLNRDSNHN